MDFKKMAQSKELFPVINFTLLFMLIFSLGLNQVLLIGVARALGLPGLLKISNLTSFIANNNSLDKVRLVGEISEDAIKLVINGGAPEIYGAELGVSFDQVEPSMNMMKQFDPTYGSQKITLAGNDLQRYINIGLKISCEFCCGAKAIISANGEAACGCAHSQAMRGLAAYLIQNHGSEYSDDEILRELARWKGMYFPKQMIQKMASQLQGGNYTPDIAALILEIKLPDYGRSGQTAPLPSEIKNLPSMVGGC